MNYKLLFLLVEGDDDERFFRKIIRPKFEEKNNSVMIWKYKQQKQEKIKSFLSSINSMGANYIYVADINRAPCITSKKQETRDKFEKIDIDRIIVVIQEIESWYLAGLDTKSSKQLGVSSSNTTDNITKEQFDKVIPKSFDSRIDFMLEILKNFSVETAKQKNRSFNYFLQKHNCEV